MLVLTRRSNWHGDVSTLHQCSSTISTSWPHSRRSVRNGALRGSEAARGVPVGGEPRRARPRGADWCPSSRANNAQRGTDRCGRGTDGTPQARARWSTEAARMCSSGRRGFRVPGPTRSTLHHHRRDQWARRVLLFAERPRVRRRDAQSSSPRASTQVFTSANRSNATWWPCACLAISAWLSWVRRITSRRTPSRVRHTTYRTMMHQPARRLPGSVPLGVREGRRGSRR